VGISSPLLTHPVSSIERVRVRGIHHLGVAVEDLEEAIATYERLFGATVERRDSLAEQGVVAASLLVGGSRVELLEPTGGDTPVGRFLARRGPGMHHVALESSDIEGTLRALADAGAELVDEHPRRGLFGTEVAFVHPGALHGVLTEVVSSG
jgi:methylmalonyl-CoA/ethylmalonyl-CoA epimerase